MPYKKGIWHDPNVMNSENKKYQGLFKTRHWTIGTTTTVASTVKMVDLPRYANHVVVLTSGKNGEELAQRLQSKNNVVAIVVFCRKKIYHSTWASKYDKVKQVCITFEESEKICAELNNAWVSLDVIQGVEDLTAGAVGGFISAQHGDTDFKHDSYGRKNWCPKCDVLPSSFLCILQHYRNTKVISEDDVVGELQKLVPVDLLEEFNRVWSEEKWRQNGQTVLQPNSLGQKLCLSYTSKYFFKPLNAKLAENRFADVINFTGAFI